MQTSAIVVGILVAVSPAFAGGKDKDCAPVTAIGAGLENSYAVVGGALKAWGLNGDGLIGNGEVGGDLRMEPIAINALSAGVIEISAQAATTCAIVKGGAIWCWGLNSGGQVGNGTSSGSDHRVLEPVATAVTSGAEALSAGGDFSCAIIKGAAKCWGSRFNKTATTVKGAEKGVTSISVGWQGMYSRGCAVVKGAVKCWRDGEAAQPQSGMASDFTQVATGGSFVCGLTKAGGVSCAGVRYGIGNGKDENAKTPTEPTGLGSGVTSIVAANMYACAVLGTGGVKCWGATPYGEHKSPEDAAGLDKGIAKIVAGANHLCALTTKNRMKCLGANTMGTLGNGTTTESQMAVDVCVKK